MHRGGAAAGAALAARVDLDATTRMRCSYSSCFSVIGDTKPRVASGTSTVAAGLRRRAHAERFVQQLVDFGRKSVLLEGEEVWAPSTHL